MDNEEIKARLLLALARKRKWGESHTAYENMVRQFKSQSFGKEVMKNVSNAAEELVREGLVVKKPTSYGLQVSLNQRMAFEIKRRIKERLGFEL